MGTSAPPEPGQMNTLTLDHQPANEGMDLAYPGLRQRTRSPVLTSVGHLDPKAKLTINGATVAANAEGNFRHRHRLRPGKISSCIGSCGRSSPTGWRCAK